MKVPVSWLKELVPITQTVEDIGESLSMAGFEVEGIDDLSTNAKGVLVGQVKECSSHPNADKLSVCLVNIAPGKDLQIVCGAPNVRKGIHVAVATVGCELNAINLKIKETQLRGVLSQGMICSLNELGIEGKTNGIAILEEISSKELVPGASVIELLDLDDQILDLAITANRPDGMSMVGIAQEVSALTSIKLKIPHIENNDKYKELETNIDSINKMKEGGIYSITSIEGIDCNKPTPPIIKNRLQKCGINSLNIIVDITNYIMMEQGQPLHAFDNEALERITKKPIRAEDFGLRQANEAETINTLDGKEVKLSNEVLVVTCHNTPIAIAGVIGSKESAVTSNTKKVWLESAVFTQKAVRQSSRLVGLRTEASSRFEKGIPIQNTLRASKRAIDLINEQFGSTKIITYATKTTIEEEATVTLRRNAIHKLLGPIENHNKKPELDISNQYNKLDYEVNEEESYITDKQIEDILISLGCSIKQKETGWDVYIPFNRQSDLLREVDLIEEVARLIGYNLFQSRLPDPLDPGGLSPKQQCERKLRQSLAQSGLQEVTTSSLVGPNVESSRVAIKNPLLVETSHLRTNLYEEHLRICQRNIKAFQSGCWIYEIGKSYIQQKTGIKEVNNLSGVICGERRLEQWSSSGKLKPLDYYEARGLLERTFRYLNIEVKDLPMKDSINLHPGRAAQLHIEGKNSGSFGQLHPAIADEMQLPRSTYIYELNLDQLVNASIRPNKLNPLFKSFTTLPPMERDIAIQLPINISCSEVLNKIKKSGKPLLEKVSLIDKFKSSELGEDNCSLTFRLTFRSTEKTLNEASILPIQEKILNDLITTYGAKQR